METELRSGLGLHLMLDCYGCPRDKLEDMGYIFGLLDDLPDQISMTKVMPPYVFKYHGQAPEDWGVSGVVLIAESHISVHTFPDQLHAFIDIFSCKEFDTDLAQAELLKRFEATHHEVVLIGCAAEGVSQGRMGSNEKRQGQPEPAAAIFGH